MSPNEETNGWFKKYTDQVLSEVERLDKSMAECSKCVKEKISRKVVMWGVGIFFTITFFTAAGIIAAYSRGVDKRQASTEYMIYAEAKKVDSKLTDYCTKDKFHAVDKKLGGLEIKVQGIDETVERMDKRSEKILETLQDLQRNRGYNGND